MALRRTTAVQPPSNPFVRPSPHSPPVVEVDLGEDEVLGRALSVRGPAVPLLITPDSPSLLSSGALVRREMTTTPTLCVAGAHGGAGATTLSALLGSGAFDAGVSWPVASGWVRPLPVLPVVLAARTHGAGLAAAERVAKAWASGELTQSRLVGLVLIDDAPRLTKTQKSAAARVARMTPMGWHIGWDPQWRETPLPPAGQPLPARVRRTLDQIRRSATT